jgi:hypothetical protein
MGRGPKLSVVVRKECGEGRPLGACEYPAISSGRAQPVSRRRLGFSSPAVCDDGCLTLHAET